MFIITGISQSTKIVEKATKKVEKINTSITEGDESQALTEAQRKKIYDLQVEALTHIRKIRKTEKDKEKQKELIKAENKRVSNQINKTILTKAQKKARKKARMKKKESKSMEK